MPALLLRLARPCRAGWRAVLLLLPLALSACSVSNPSSAGIAQSLRPYRIDVVQGNFVSQEMAQSLRPGMKKDEVRNLLGTPLLQDLFHGERWEYVFSLRQGYQPPLVRRFTVQFDADGRLLSTQGDPLPSEDQFVGQINDLHHGGSAPKRLTQDQLQAQIDAAHAKLAAAPAGASSAAVAATPLTLLAPAAEIHQLESYAPAPTQP